MVTFNDNIKKEIERKAKAGESLTHPTQEKQDYYNQVQSQFSAPTQGATTTSAPAPAPNYAAMAMAQQQAAQRKREQEIKQQAQKDRDFLSGIGSQLGQRRSQYEQQQQFNQAQMQSERQAQDRARRQAQEDLIRRYEELAGSQQAQSEQRYGELRDSYQRLLDSLDGFQQNNPIDNINLDDFKTVETSIDELAAKYGFDYSRDYADTQASAEAEAVRNALRDVQRQNQSQNQQNLQGIDNAVMNTAEALDRDYFQQMLAQQQNQVNSGLNAGLAADQNLRLQMARQAEMSPIYRDANLGRMQENQRYTNEDLRLLESLGLVDQQELARADQLYNDRRQQGFENAMNYDNARRSENLAMLQAALQERGQNMDMTQFLQSLAQQGGQFNWQAGQQMDQDAWNRFLDQAGMETQQQQFNDTFGWEQLMNIIGNSNWNQSFNAGLDQQEWQRALDEVGTGQWWQQFNQNQNQIDWSQMLDMSHLTGQIPGGGGQSVQEQQRQWQNQFDQRNQDQAEQQQQWQNQFNQSIQDWSRMMDQIFQTGQLPDFMGGGQSVQEQQRQFANRLAQEQFNRPYEELTAYEKARIEAEQRAYERQQSGTGSGSGEGQKENLFSLPSTHFQNVIEAYTNGDETTREWLRSQFDGIENLVKTDFNSAEIQAFIDGLDPSKERLEDVYKQIDAKYEAGIYTAEERLQLREIAKGQYEAKEKENGSKGNGGLVEAITPRQNPLFNLDTFQNVLDWFGNLRQDMTAPPNPNADYSQVPSNPQSPIMNWWNSTRNFDWSNLLTPEFWGAVPPSQWQDHYNPPNNFRR